MTFLSNLTKFLHLSHGEPQAKPASVESSINLSQSVLTHREYCTGASLLSSIEKTTALVKLLKESSLVSVDRIAGKIELEHHGRLIKADLLQVASEIYLKASSASKLYMVPSSPLSSSMTPEHLHKVRSLLNAAAEDGRAPRYAGIIATSPANRPYSRLGKAPYTPLPDTIQHGDYQFFIPGPERAATVQFLAGLSRDGHVLLPSIVLNGEAAKPSSNVSVSPLWQFAALGAEINSWLQKTDPAVRFYGLIYEWGNFLSFARYDLVQTLAELAQSLGLDITEQGPRFRGGPTRFSIGSGNPDKELVVHLAPLDSSGRQELAIGWAKHHGYNEAV